MKMTTTSRGGGEREGRIASRARPLRRLGRSVKWSAALAKGSALPVSAWRPLVTLSRVGRGKLVLVRRRESPRQSGGAGRGGEGELGAFERQAAKKNGTNLKKKPSSSSFPSTLRCRCRCSKSTPPSLCSTTRSPSLGFLPGWRPFASFCKNPFDSTTDPRKSDGERVSVEGGCMEEVRWVECLEGLVAPLAASGVRVRGAGERWEKGEEGKATGAAVGSGRNAGGGQVCCWDATELV